MFRYRTPCEVQYCAAMGERYSLSDRQMYGAEDDFEMDMILDAIDRALEPPKSETSREAKTSPAPASTVVCAKTPYRTQAAARTALERWRTARPDDAKLPHRVYPCDRCDAWHLTGKRSGRGTPPWDRDPEWERTPAQVQRLQRRFDHQDPVDCEASRSTRVAGGRESRERGGKGA